MKPPARRSLPDRSQTATTPAPAPVDQPDPIELIDPARIRTDGGTQMRAALNTDTVVEYRHAMTDPQGHPAWGNFPPLILYYDGSDYWLADGFHRLAAWRGLLIRRTIAADPATPNASASFPAPARIIAGDRRAAILHAAAANATHGLRRTNADKRRAIETLLRDDQWRSWSDQEIARRCAVDPKTVGTTRRQLTAAQEIAPTPTRRTADGRTLNTAPIGATRPKPPPPLSPSPSPTPSPLGEGRGGVPDRGGEPLDTWAAGAVGLNRNWTAAEVDAYHRSFAVVTPDAAPQTPPPPDQPPPTLENPESPPPSPTPSPLGEGRGGVPQPGEGRGGVQNRIARLRTLQAIYQTAHGSLDEYAAITGRHVDAMFASRQLSDIVQTIQRHLDALSTTTQETHQETQP